MSLSQRLLLDTNILVHLLRRGRAGAWIEKSFQLGQRQIRPLICVVSIGEILGLCNKWSWGPKRRRQIDELLRELTIFDINYD